MRENFQLKLISSAISRSHKLENDQPSVQTSQTLSLQYHRVVSYVDGAEERRKILSKLTLRSENNIKTLQKKVVVTAENIYE